MKGEEQKGCPCGRYKWGHVKSNATGSCHSCYSAALPPETQPRCYLEGLLCLSASLFSALLRSLLSAWRFCDSMILARKVVTALAQVFILVGFNSSEIFKRIQENREVYEELSHLHRFALTIINLRPTCVSSSPPTTIPLDYFEAIFKYVRTDLKRDNSFLKKFYRRSM